jgi:MoxR-like ATPase
LKAAASNPGELEISPRISHLIKLANSVILGKEREVKLAVATLLSGGHLLITDRPGVGKTTLANTLARLFGLSFKRIQFTSDLLPADITGVSIFDPEAGAFTFHPGPVFAQLVLADEINRATPKCQSALLEAMEERQVTVDRTTHPLPLPFFVIATRNASEQSGTFALPESQLDRFTLGISLGYPDREAERQMLSHSDPRDRLVELKPVFDTGLLKAAQRAVAMTNAAPALLDYLQAILQFSRKDHAFASGYSPRAGMSLLTVARAWAFIEGRSHVLPEDLQAVIPHSIHHLEAREPGTDLSQHLLTRVAIP